MILVIFTRKVISRKVHRPTCPVNARHLLVWVFRERCVYFYVVELIRHHIRAYFPRRHFRSIPHMHFSLNFALAL